MAVLKKHGTEVTRLYKRIDWYDSTYCATASIRSTGEVCIKRFMAGARMVWKMASPRHRLADSSGGRSVKRPKQFVATCDGRPFITLRSVHDFFWIELIQCGPCPKSVLQSLTEPQATRLRDSLTEQLTYLLATKAKAKRRTE